LAEINDGTLPKGKQNLVSIFNRTAKGIARGPTKREAQAARPNGKKN
jgi:hypothetical protein